MTEQEEKYISHLLTVNKVNGDNLLKVIAKIGKIFQKTGIVSTSCNWYVLEDRLKEFKKEYTKYMGGNVICLPRNDGRWTIVHTLLTKKEISTFFELKAFL